MVEILQSPPLSLSLFLNPLLIEKVLVYPPVMFLKGTLNVLSGGTLINMNFGDLQDSKPTVGKDRWVGKVNFVEIRSYWHMFRSFDRMWSFFILCLQVTVS